MADQRSSIVPFPGFTPRSWPSLPTADVVVIPSAFGFANVGCNVEEAACRCAALLDAGHTKKAVKYWQLHIAAVKKDAAARLSASQAERLVAAYVAAVRAEITRLRAASDQVE
jgi:protein-disulfide isomerase